MDSRKTRHLVCSVQLCTPAYRNGSMRIVRQFQDTLVLEPDPTNGDAMLLQPNDINLLSESLVVGLSRHLTIDTAIMLSSELVTHSPDADSYNEAETAVD